VTPASSPTDRVRALVRGRASGTALVLKEPLSLWGGFDVATGRLIDPRHPQHGAALTGRVVVMPSGRGSSSSSSVLAEAVRLETAPAGFVLYEADPILVLGAVVAEELYGRAVPVVVSDPGLVVDGATVEIDGDRLSVLPPGTSG
jgi:predicted aconitase with swiveling domain